MADLAAALEVQWGEAHKRSGQRMLLLWGTLNNMPALCWGPVSHPGITVHIAVLTCMQHQHRSWHVHCAKHFTTRTCLTGRRCRRFIRVHAALES